MKANLLSTVATIGFTLVGASAIAYAQDNPNEKQNRPAMERMEKDAPNEAGQSRAQKPEPSTSAQKREEQPRTGQAEEPKRQVGESRAGQAEQPNRKDNERRAGEAEPKRQEGEPRSGQAAEPKRKAGESQTTEAPRPPRRENDAKTDQGAQPGENREGMNRGEPDDKTTNNGRADNNARARGSEHVRVTGNLHVSEERATRISEKLMSTGRHEHIDERVEVGSPLPETIALEPLPPEIVELAPEYRGYDYVVSDDEIIFVQPSTHEVVSMIAADETTAGDASVARAKPCPVD